VKQQTIQKEPEPKYSLNDNYKSRPRCGQGKIPFKLGICTCGEQVGTIQYVDNPEKFAKRYYSYIVNEYNTAVAETFARLEKWK